VRRLSAGSRPSTVDLTDDLAAGLVVGLAYPERIARARTPGSRTYLMTGGTAAELAAGSTMVNASWLAIAVADRTRGAAAARVRLAAAIDEATAREAAAGLLVDGEEVAWRDGDVLARRVHRLGAIVLSEDRLARPDPAMVAAAIAEGVRTEGLGLLSWRPDAVALRERLAFVHGALGEAWPAVDDEALLARFAGVARSGAGPGPAPRRPGPQSTLAAARAPPARLAGGGQPRPGRPGTVDHAQWAADPGRLRRSGCPGAGGEDPGCVRLDRRTPDRQRLR